MYSFYGGRPGNSFIIITTFQSVSDMIEAFSHGPNYTDVHFDEHVLINTEDKNSPDNGKIFRRGYNYKDELGGAIQIGQIVGPAGPAPFLSLTDYRTVEEMNQSSTISSDQIKKDSGSYNINSSLIPGYDEEHNKYNDKIEWISCSIKTQDSGECNAYIGFKIPYLVMDWQAKTIDSYENPTIEEKDESKSHPFYKKWELGIPKGRTGTSLSDLKIKKYNLVEDGDIKTVDGQSYQGIQGQNILIYNQTDYENNNPQGITTRKYLGKYNIIQDIKHENGKLKIKCTNDNDEYREFEINEIENIELNPDTGQFIIKYFNNDNQTVFSLNWVKDVEFDENEGTLTFKYANSETQEKICPINWIKDAEVKTDTSTNVQKLYFKWANPIDGNTDRQVSNFRWIKNLNLTEDGYLQAIYNDNSPSEPLNPNNPINWVTSIRVNKDTGALQCVTNNPEKVYNINTKDGFRWITGVTINEDKQLVIHYNNTQKQIIPEPIKFIDDVSLDTDGYLNVQYNTDSEMTQIGQIRQVQNLTMDENSGEITITYNTGTSQIIGTVRYLESVSIADNNQLMIKYSNEENAISVGSVAANLEFIGDSATNLNWSGVGYISVQTQENQGVLTTFKYLNFTTPTTSLIGERSVFVSNCNNLTATLKNSSQQSISFNQEGSSISDLISINKTLIGLNFSITILEDINSSIYNNLTDGTLVDIFISGVDLYFM